MSAKAQKLISGQTHLSAILPYIYHGKPKMAKEKSKCLQMFIGRSPFAMPDLLCCKCLLGDVHFGHDRFTKSNETTKKTINVPKHRQIMGNIAWKSGVD